MKKLLIATLCVLSFSAQAFNQERFNEDMSYYKSDKGRGYTITILLAPFNSDHAVRQASDLYNQGDTSKWLWLEDKLVAAVKKGETIMPETYMSPCASATKYAATMWKFATYMTSNNFGEWDNPEVANLKMYNNAKAKFQDLFQKCKSAVNNPPDQKDY